MARADVPATSFHCGVHVLRLLVIRLSGQHLYRNWISNLSLCDHLQFRRVSGPVLFDQPDRFRSDICYQPVSPRAKSLVSGGSDFRRLLSVSVFDHRSGRRQHAAHSIGSKFRVAVMSRETEFYPRRRDLWKVISYLLIPFACCGLWIFSLGSNACTGTGSALYRQSHVCNPGLYQVLFIAVILAMFGVMAVGPADISQRSGKIALALFFVLGVAAIFIVFEGIDATPLPSGVNPECVHCAPEVSTVIPQENTHAE